MRRPLKQKSVSARASAVANSLAAKTLKSILLDKSSLEVSPIDEFTPSLGDLRRTTVSNAIQQILPARFLVDEDGEGAAFHQLASG